jgi:hypothetical protein
MALPLRRQQVSPFLPDVPGIAGPDIGKVTFPGTTQAGRGLLSFADRDPNNPANDAVPVRGPSSYTRQPTQLRTVGLHQPRLVGRDARAFRKV